MRPSIKTVAIVAAVVFVGAALLSFDKISPSERTYTRMVVTEGRIRDYAKTHRTLPAKLSDLPKLEGNRDSSLVDGWGRELVYLPESERSVTLLSYGSSGQPGAADTLEYFFAVREE